MTRQVINNGTIANDGTGDTLRAAATKINENFLELYSALGDPDNAFPNISIGNSAITFEGLLNNAFDTTLSVVEPTAVNTINLPNASGTVTLDTNTQTLKYKTLDSCSVSNIGLRFWDANNTHRYNVIGGDISANKIARLPVFSDRDSDYFVFRDQPQTLINKTLTSATLTNPIINKVSGANAESIITFTTVGATGTNYVDVTNGSAYPLIKAVGTANDVNLRISSRGTNGEVVIRRGSVAGGTDGVSGTINVGKIVGSTGVSYDLHTLTDNTTMDININKMITRIDSAGGAVSSLSLSVANVGTIKHVLNNTSSNKTITLGTGTFQSGLNTLTVKAKEGCTLVALGSSGVTWFNVYNTI